MKKMSQTSTAEQQTGDGNKKTHRRRFVIGMGVSAVSGVLTAASMPNFDFGFVGWVALVPLLIAIEARPKASPTALAMPFGLIWSIAVHNWYPNMFGPVLGGFPVFDTPHGKVGIGVCWDRHRLWITRELARAGAQIVLMPVDDDFNHNRWFPAFHASDSVFRAVENRVAFGLGTTSGISLVVDPYGRVMAESGINKRTAIIGKVFTASGTTLYTRFGDWFGWLMVTGVVIMIGLVLFNRQRDN